MWRYSRRWLSTPYGRDAVAAGILAAVLVGGMLLVVLLVNARRPVPSPDVTLQALVIVSSLTIAGCATIAVRRRWPRSALAVATGLVLVCAAVELASVGPGIGLVVCAYTASTLLPWRRLLPLAGLAVVHTVGGVLITRAGGGVRGLPTFWGVPGQDLSAMVVATAASYGIPAVIGALVRRRRERTAALIDRAERLEAERDERDRAAAAAERGRIARELHDIAAHDLSAIVVQAGAADRLVDGDPAAAKAVLRSIRGQGRDTLAALRQLVGIMREDDTGGRAPQPGLARIDELIALARAAGMTVDVRRSGEPARVPPLVDLAAYRVVQESLTNARQHAPGAVVAVDLGYGSGIHVSVRNTASVTAQHRDSSADPGGGHGLAGMRERVRQAGGTLSAGPTSDGGWLVVAHLPVPSTVEGDR